MHLFWQAVELHCWSCWFYFIPEGRGGGIGGVLFCLYFRDAIAATSLCFMKEKKSAGL